MIQIHTFDDVYPAIDELIIELKGAGQTRLANILHHRMHVVAWNSRNEIFEELSKVLTISLKSDQDKLPKLFKEQIEHVLFVINNFIDSEKKKRRCFLK